MCNFLKDINPSDTEIILVNALVGHSDLIRTTFYDYSDKGLAQSGASSMFRSTQLMNEVSQWKDREIKMT